VKDREKAGDGDGDDTPVHALAPRLLHQLATATTREEQRLSEKEGKGAIRAPQQW